MKTVAVAKQMADDPKELRRQIGKLKSAVGAAYQMLGAAGAPADILDNFSALLNGDAAPYRWRAWTPEKAGRTAYICGTDLGNEMTEPEMFGDCRITPNLSYAQSEWPCSDECGIAEVEITFVGWASKAKRRKYGEAGVVARPHNSAIEDAYRTKGFIESRDREEPAYQRELKELKARATKASKAAAKARTAKAKGKGGE